jgi:uncharacterized protein involved in outer membrane biogenesis
MKWGAISVLALLATIGFLIALIAAFDWNRAKPWINERVSNATGRMFAVRGDLTVDWQAPPASVTGWRRWIPWAHVRAHDIVLGNPDWVDAPSDMARIKQLSATIAPLPLLRRQVIVPELRLDTPRLHLQRAGDGRNNWTFDDGPPSAWHFRLDRLRIDSGMVRLVDGIRNADIRAGIDSRADDTIAWKLTGSLAGDEVSGSGEAGRILALQEQQTQYPIKADLKVGKTRIAANGTLTNPRQLAALDLELKLSGVNMAHLHPITGIVLPDTFPYSTRGHLLGSWNRDGSHWRYEAFKGKVGSSDISGTLEYQVRQPRPLLTGRVTSRVLHFDDLAPLIGADSNASKIRRGARPVQPRDKALPVEEFGKEAWTSIDADVRFSGRKIVRRQALPIDNLVTHIRLQAGVLTLAPLNFGVAGGKLTSRVTLDGRDASIKAKMKASARGLQLKRLFPAFEPMNASLGQINGDAALSATGNSIAELLGSSNGEVRALIDQGTISKLLLETMGLNIGSVILTRVFGDRQVELNCLASDFKVTKGVMSTRLFMMDTEAATLQVSGSISLAQESLDLTLEPHSKGVRIISLRAPLYVTGSFKNPDVDVDKGVLALKAGSALALSALAPAITALLPLVNTGKGKESPCGALLAQAKEKPVAPPPGKTPPGSR